MYYAGQFLLVCGLLFAVNGLSAWPFPDGDVGVPWAILSLQVGAALIVIGVGAIIFSNRRTK